MEFYAPRNGMMGPGIHSKLGLIKSGAEQVSSASRSGAPLPLKSTVRSEVTPSDSDYDTQSPSPGPVTSVPPCGLLSNSACLQD